MWSSKIITFTTATALFWDVAFATPDTRRNLKRDYITEDQLSDSYDFVIVGAGIAGLTLASRLSEDANTTVLVLEAGLDGSTVKNKVDIPGNAFYDSLWGTTQDWGFQTIPQAALTNRQIYLPRGKVDGGSSAMNAMYYVRPSCIEVDTWAALASPSDPDRGANGLWGCDAFFSAMKKTENFTPPLPDIQSQNHIRFDASHHGTSGPLDVTYCAATLPVTGAWTPSLEAMGIESSGDPYGGRNIGGYIAASSINPTNWTRAYAKSAYIDSLPPRSNLAILSNSTVTRVPLADSSSSSSGLTATGVEFASSRDSPRKTVKAKKEVIVSAGALNSAQVLMLSGIGPKADLDAAHVEIKEDLPGVGQHLQDHIMAGISWRTEEPTAGDIHNSGSDYSRSKEFLSLINTAMAYVNTSLVLGDSWASDYKQQLNDYLSEASQTLVPSQSPDVIEGYKVISNTLANTFLLDSSVGQVEFLLATNSPGTISVQASLQHPLSRGKLTIKSSDPFEYPEIDPKYFSHFGDRMVLRQGFRILRNIAQTAPMSGHLREELSPGTQIQSDSDLDAWLDQHADTQFHLSSTCAMLPRNQGGVVDDELRVYGTNNLRVIDSSVFPFIFAAHLAATTFALAEQAADMIHTQYKTSKSGLPAGSDPLVHTGPSGSGTGKSGSSQASQLTTSSSLSIFLVALSMISYILV